MQVKTTLQTSEVSGFSDISILVEIVLSFKARWGYKFHQMNSQNVEATQNRMSVAGTQRQPNGGLFF